MAEPTAVSVILEPIGLIFSGLASIHWSWWASRVASLLAWPWKLLLLPIRLIVRVVLAILAPAILVLGYILGALRAVLSFLASFEPLYKFFGAAAFVGIIAGLVIGISSTYITTYFGMQDELPEDDILYASPSSAFATKQRQRRFLTDTDDLDSVKDDSSASTEFDMQWLEPSSSPTRRRLVSGLLSQTIHEEDDDGSDGAL